VRIVVTDLDLNVACDRAQSWDYEYDFEILQRSVPLDGWRFKVKNLQAKADNTAAPETETIRNFFERWGATFVRRDSDGVVLDWIIADGAQSDAFLGVTPALVGITMAESGYDEGTGWHSYTIDWSLATIEGPRNKIAHRISILGGVLMTEAATLAEFRLHRDNVRTAFVNEVKNARTMYKRRRYSFPTSDVDAALSVGGVLTLTAAQVTSRIIDARAE